VNIFDEPVEPTPGPPDGDPEPKVAETPAASPQTAVSPHPAVEPGSVLRSHHWRKAAAIAGAVIALAAIGTFALAHSSKPASAGGVAAQQPYGRGGFRNGGGRGMGLRGMLGSRSDQIAIVAQTIGISQNELISDVRSGQSIADIAKAHNVDPQKVIDAIYKADKQQIADLVSSGRITHAQAQRIESVLRDRIAARVNGTALGPPAGGTSGI
jgi:hypothetical protein